MFRTGTFLFLIAIPVVVWLREKMGSWSSTIEPKEEDDAFMKTEGVILLPKPTEGEEAPAKKPAAGEEEVPAAQEASKKHRWDALRGLLEKWEFTSNYAVSIGNAKQGRLFVYEGGTFKMDKKIPTGSTSKWPSAMMFAGLVNKGTGPVASLDDPIYKYLDWWTQDPKDLRSTITLRMLLSFTSGFGGGHPGEESNNRAAREWRAKHNKTRDLPLGLEARLAPEIGQAAAKKCNLLLGDIVNCAKSIYEGVKLGGIPGQVYSYNSNHLQIAAAVAVSATGLGIHDVISKYLFTPYNMTGSSYPGSCPDFGGSLMTTGDDYDKFLAGIMNYSVLAKDIVDASEQDYTPFMSDQYTLYGDYGFGHFLFCFDSVDGFTDKCKEDRVHADPGAFGFIPLVDRKRGYYMQVVSAEIPPFGNYALSGIPEYLTVALKPHVDAILSNKPPDAGEHTSHSLGLLTLAMADVNYCLKCKLHPLKCIV